MTRRVVPFKIFEEVPPVGNLARPDPIGRWRGDPWYAPRRDSRAVGLDDTIGPTRAEYETGTLAALLDSLSRFP